MLPWLQTLADPARKHKYTLSILLNFFFEMGSHCVKQVGYKLWSPCLGLSSTRTIGMCHHDWLSVPYQKVCMGGGRYGVCGGGCGCVRAYAYTHECTHLYMCWIVWYYFLFVCVCMCTQPCMPWCICRGQKTISVRLPDFVDDCFYLLNPVCVCFRVF